ncbi:MAG: class II fructose-bisphosphate aldolase [Candidatus Pacebacteria bacterium]|nr:class II fructose-bisphosphate aldolase [Candidatus Paceibacterota bacterium]
MLKVKSLRQYISEASAQKKAIGHFNISNLEGFWAVVRAAQAVSEKVFGEKNKVPVIVGTSEGERDFIGLTQAVALVRSVRDSGQPVFLNADHTYSFERVKEAIDAGYDMAIFDGAKLSIEENITQTKKCVEYARTKSSGFLSKIFWNDPRDILLEGELGYIGQSSKILDAIPEGAMVNAEALTKPSDAVRFIKETGIDLLAPAVGNFHGMLRGGKDPALNIPTVASIYQAVGLPLVLHGASGNSAEDIAKSVENGVAIVHVSTELRVAYTTALKASLAAQPDENTPYKLSIPALNAMQKLVEKKIRIIQRIV